MTISDKVLKALLQIGPILLLVLLMSIFQKAEAQSRRGYVSVYTYKGIEGSFGIKSMNIKSDIPEISNLKLIEEGGNAGFVFGNSFSRMVVKPLGFYSSSSSVGKTINLFTVEAENNTYLLKGLLKRPTKFDVYSLLGINFSSFKFFGHYINAEQRPGSEARKGHEPYLGKVENLMMTLGAGIEYRLMNNSDFVHAFVAGKYHIPMQETEKTDAFNKTEFTDVFDISVGLRFGMVSYNKKIHRRL